MSSNQHLKEIPSDSKPFSKPPPGFSTASTNCEVDIQLDSLRDAIHVSKLPSPTYETSTPDHRTQPLNSHGISLSWIQEAAQKWKEENSFNWSAIQSKINSVPHFWAQIKYEEEDYKIHYTALWSSRPDATGIVLIHGWPGCFLEFLPMMNHLQEKYTPETLPYHIIVPSMPGYTFSTGPPQHKDFTTRDTVEIFKLLLSDLGFSPERPYISQGGDIGSRIARGLAVLDASCTGVHLNFCFDLPMSTYSRSDLTTTEQKGLARMDTFLDSGTGYALMHATRPSTTSLILSASPIALLAWLAEKYIAWSDVPTLDTEIILTFTTLYWVTETLPRSIYPYRTDFHNRDEVPAHGGTGWNVPSDKALGYSYFPLEILSVPRSWVERTRDGGGKEEVFWREHASGGHFAALERPEEFWRDLEEFGEVVRGE